MPLLTKESAIHPPKFAEKAIVSQGKTESIPDSVRLNFSTYRRINNQTKSQSTKSYILLIHHS